MSTTSIVRIKATSSGNEPLVSILESNLDLDQVYVERAIYEVKAITPLDLLIEVATIYLLEKLILAPLIDPVAEKFNWVKAVSRYLKPIQRFNLVINVEEENLVIDASTGTNHQLTGEVWINIQKTLKILRNENLLSQITKVRFVQGDHGEVFIVCYQQNRPTWIVNLVKEHTESISTEQFRTITESEIQTEEQWMNAVLAEAEAYRKYIAELSDENRNSRDLDSQDSDEGK